MLGFWSQLNGFYLRFRVVVAVGGIVVWSHQNRVNVNGQNPASILEYGSIVKDSASLKFCLASVAILRKRCVRVFQEIDLLDLLCRFFLALLFELVDLFKLCCHLLVEACQCWIIKCGGRRHICRTVDSLAGRISSSECCNCAEYDDDPSAFHFAFPFGSGA